MTGCQVIIKAMQTTQQTLLNYISDFSDADLLVRPTPAANHAAWQIGNVIVGDSFLLQSMIPDAYFPPLPEGFADLHGSSGASKDNGFPGKATYIKLFTETRQAAINAVLKLTDADLDKPTPENMKWAGETLAEVLMFLPIHTMMHAGQFSVIRRYLGKPVLF